MDKELMHKIIKTWTMFGFNYSYGWIEEAFKSRGKIMVDHLKGKFEVAYDVAGAHGSFFYFWAMLDKENKELLENWVMDNYKG